MQKFLFIILVIGNVSKAQVMDSLNTAKNCGYMSADEKEMIYEINRVRCNPQSYLQYIEPQLAEARKILKNSGKGYKNYSLTYSTRTTGGKEIKTVDTNWHYSNEEQVKALSTLISDLKKLKKFSPLQPDSGIYKAARKQANDEDAHDWTLIHTGSDGSEPWDRITTFSPSMSFGNENMAGRSGMMHSPRDFVIQLLIDSGIPGYGHRYNLLDPKWTHVACIITNYKGMDWCIQNFGVVKR
jgi:uncharacterized protein YkwD